MSNEHPVQESLVGSYLTLRKAVGVIGVALPVVLLFGGLIHGTGVQNSISRYYHTAMGDVLVGALSAAAVFFFFYRGYPDEWKGIRLDHWVGNIAGLGALGVAFFPTKPKTGPLAWTIWGEQSVELMGFLHGVSTAVFFGALIVYCLFLFKRSAKPRRNTIYKVCGWVMVACLVFIGAYQWIDQLRPLLEDAKPVLLAETVGLWAFGLSWFVKGLTHRERSAGGQ